jgi:hypothetical protein
MAAKAAAENEINKTALQMVLVQMQLAGWHAAALPAELQPYATHFQAALLLW